MCLDTAAKPSPGIERERRVTAHPLAEGLFAAITVLEESWIRIVFGERREVIVDLLVRVEDARGGCGKEPLCIRFLRGKQHVVISDHAQSAERFVVFDGAHAARVSGQLVDLLGTAEKPPLDCDVAGFAGQRAGAVFDVVEDLIPLIERLDVGKSNVAATSVAKHRDQLAGDEPAGTGHHCRLRRFQGRITPFGPRCHLLPPQPLWSLHRFRAVTVNSTVRKSRAAAWHAIRYAVAPRVR